MSEFKEKVPKYLAWIEDDNYLVYSDGRIYSICSSKFLSQVTRKGYFVVTLRDKTKAGGRITSVHIMVAKLFCPNPDNKPFVDHIDRNKQNNHYTNLRWVTQAENVKNSDAGGSRDRPVKQYTMDMKFIKEFKSMKKASEITGISYSNIKKCCAGVQKSVIDYKNDTRHIWKYSEEREKIEITDDMRPIPDYEGYYITDDGRIYSCVLKNFMQPVMDTGGYMIASLKKNTEQKRIFVHRLVAEVFIENKPENYKDLCVNHIDGNPVNNHVSNLEYATLSENSLHSCRVLGNNCKKVNVYDAKTGELIRKFPSVKSASDFYGKNYQYTLELCKTGKCMEGKYILKYD